VAAAVALAVIVAAAGAEDSTEATTFGADGVAGSNLGTLLYPAELTGVTARPDGGFVVRQGDHLDSYLADGAPDPAAPPVPVPVPVGRTFPAAGGKSYVLDRRNLTRLRPDGTADPSFGKGGTAEVPKGTVGVVELSSGKIDAITINLHVGKNPRVVLEVVILQPDGRSGARQDFTHWVEPSASYETFREAPATPDGGALVVGGSFIFRLRPDGTVDKRFGGYSSSVGEEAFAGARILADGSIEAVGTRHVDGEAAGPAVFRYTATGKPVTSFGTEGVKLIEAPDWKQAEVASWGADGSVLLGGLFELTGEECPGEHCEGGPALAAFDSEGDPETGFGEGGLVRLSALAGPSGETPNYRRVDTGVTALTRRPDGSIIAVGSAPPNERTGFLAALSPGGAVVSSFGAGGIVRVSEPGPSSQGVVGIAALAGGGLLAAGESDVGGGPTHPVLVRYEADGGLDRSFGAGAGFVDLASTNRSRPTALAVGGDEALVGFGRGSGSRLLMTRTDDGSPVTTFGSGGSVDLPPEAGLRALLLEPDGDPVVLGNPGGITNRTAGVLLRFRADGSADRTFGTDGQVRLRGSGTRSCQSLAAAPGGGLLVGCLGDGRLVVVRLLPSDRLDPHYGGSLGRAIVPVAGFADSVKVAQVGSRTYVAGTAAEAGHLRLALARLDSHGHLNRAFGHRGIRTATLPTRARPTAIVPTAAGVVVTLESGPRPVITFTPGGAVRREAPGPTTGTRTFGNVHATASGNRLVLGWSPSRKPVGEGTYFLSERPLEP
jgi:uncharacterized delta-60 repeat protein